MRSVNKDLPGFEWKFTLSDISDTSVSQIVIL
jgi:hypothetical protein